MNITREEADLIFESEGEEIETFYSIQKYIAMSYAQCEVYCEQHNLSSKDILKWCREEV